MTSEQTARRLLASIPGWEQRSVEIVALQGGRNNHSYRVSSEGRHYVLRTGSSATVAGGGNRALEVEVQRQAAAAGLAASVLYADVERDLLLLNYLPGSTIVEKDLSSDAILQQLGVLLRRLHDLPLTGVNFDAPRAAADYVRAIGAKSPESSFGSYCVELINEMPAPGERRCCHNDVIAENIVQGEGLQLIDFEYACDNDPLFDLASVLCWHDLGEHQHAVLLASYAGQVDEELSERLRVQCRLFDALQWLWLAARQHQHREAWVTQKMQQAQQRLV